MDAISLTECYTIVSMVEVLSSAFDTVPLFSRLYGDLKLLVYGAVDGKSNVQDPD